MRISLFSRRLQPDAQKEGSNRKRGTAFSRRPSADSSRRRPVVQVLRDPPGADAPVAACEDHVGLARQVRSRLLSPKAGTTPPRATAHYRPAASARTPTVAVGPVHAGRKPPSDRCTARRRRVLRRASRCRPPRSRESPAHIVARPRAPTVARGTAKARALAESANSRSTARAGSSADPSLLHRRGLGQLPDVHGLHQVRPPPRAGARAFHAVARGGPSKSMTARIARGGECPSRHLQLSCARFYRRPRRPTHSNGDGEH
jgi:hypothetical protein